MLLIVCIKFLTKFADGLSSSEKDDVGVVEKKFREVCGQAKKKENRFVRRGWGRGVTCGMGCWYVD